MKLRTGDIFIFVIIVAIALFVLLFKNKKGDFAVLEVDGVVVKSFDLSYDDEYIFHGDYENKIVVSNGKIFFLESSCPDKTCVNSGKIGSDGGVLCCLPNKAMLYITSSIETDVISG